MGVPLPSPVSHGIWNVPGSAGGGMTGLRTAVTVGILWVTMPVLASAQDTHAGHEQQKPAAATTPASEQHQAPTELPSFIPPVTDEERKAAFPDVQGHTVHDNGMNYFVLLDQLE